MLRRDHDFSGADAVRDQLTAEHGVTVYDRDNEWFVGGGFSRGGGGAEGSEGRPGGGRLADYSRQSNDDAPVDVEAVEALLSERSRMRERRMWDEADAVREQLTAEHGVTVRDKDFEWFVGGGPGERRGGREERPARQQYNERQDYSDNDGPPPEVSPMPVALRLQTEFGVLGHDYARVPADGTPLSADDFEPINGLLAARVEAKRSRRFDEADALKAMLLEEHGVMIDDNARVWRADGVPFDPKAWTRIAGDGDVPGEAAQTVFSQRRDDTGDVGADAASGAARAEEGGGGGGGDGALSADALGKLTVPLLKERLKARGLRVGGVKAELVARLLEAPPEASPAAPPAAAAAAAAAAPESIEAEGGAVAVDGKSGASGGGGEGVDVATVESLLAVRGQAKQSKDYPRADELTATLRAEHGVVLDDKRRTWRVVVEYGGYYRVGPHVDPFTTKQVGSMLETRSRHQEAQEYAAADALEEELGAMGIVIDRRNKTWKKPAAKERDRRAPGRDRYPRRDRY